MADTNPGLRSGRPRRGRLGVVLVMIFLVAGLVAGASGARAQIGSERYSSLIMEAATGNIISAINPDDIRFPASLTKMMTLYLTFEALRDRRVALGQFVPVSAHAAAMSPSKLGLLPGSRITVEQAIMALVTKSANDAAAAMGELLGGDEERFAQMMTLRGRALGMTRTVFRNASGLPDLRQVTTARDLALLARHLVQDFPAEYRYFSVPSFVYRGTLIPNHDRMLTSYPGADGIKTGYIEASGCNLVTSAVRGDVRLIGVVLGAARAVERDQHMAALLDTGFERMGVPIAPRPEPAPLARLGLLASAQAASPGGAMMPSAPPNPRPLFRRVAARSPVAAALPRASVTRGAIVAKHVAARQVVVAHKAAVTVKAGAAKVGGGRAAASVRGRAEARQATRGKTG